MINRNTGYSDIPRVLKDYLTYMNVIKGKSKNTVKEYYYDLRLFLRYMYAKFNNLTCDDYSEIDITNFDDKILADVTLSDLYDYMAYINNNHSDNDNYRARKVSSIKSFFNYLDIKSEILNENPAAHLESPKIKKRLPIYMSLDESADFLKSIDGKYKNRDLAMFLILLTCGLRVSELVGINIGDIDFNKKTLRVIGKGNKERVVFLNDMCIDAIKSYMEVRPTDVAQADKNAMFISSKNKRITSRSVEILSKKYFMQAGVDPKKFTPHKLRHTAATIMYRDGHVDVRTLQELLGHESLSTTQIYTHIANDDLKNAAEKNPLTKISLKNSKNE